MAYTEEQIDYIINLAKQLEFQRVEREVQGLEEAQRVIYRTKEVIEKSNKLKEVKHDLDELRYDLRNPDPPIDLGDGKVLITLWKALPQPQSKELEQEKEKNKAFRLSMRYYHKDR
jgi:hypothetical protein